MTLHQVRLDETPAQPWKNGGGLTHELLAWPPGSGVDWQVRVSVATIAADGPFSAFAGVRRWFAVLEGDGVRLSQGAASLALKPGDAPWHFDGGQPPDCRLLGGATRDLNLMLRGAGTMTPARADTLLSGAFAWRALYTHEALALQLPDRHLALPAGTLAWSDDSAAAVWRVDSTESDHAPRAPRAYWLTLQAH